MENKNNNLVIAVILLSVALIASLGYIIYKNQNNDKLNESLNESTESIESNVVLEEEATITSNEFTLDKYAKDVTSNKTLGTMKVQSKIMTLKLQDSCLYLNNDKLIDNLSYELSIPKIYNTEAGLFVIYGYEYQNIVGYNTMGVINDLLKENEELTDFAYSNNKIEYTVCKINACENGEPKQSEIIYSSNIKNGLLDDTTISSQKDDVMCSASSNCN